MNNYAQILYQAYDQFLLSLGGKKVPTPYRRNEIGSFQKLAPEFQGKSSPEVLINSTQKMAKIKNFDLNKASVEEIRRFMRKNKIGIDCSGFAYRMLNFLVQKVKGKSLEAFGLPHVGRTNVAKLTSNEFTKPVKNIRDTQVGDIIKIDAHCMIIVEKTSQEIIYAHSSGESNPVGVHLGQIKIIDPQKSLQDQVWLEKFKSMQYNEKNGDSIKRLKFLRLFMD